MIGRWLEERRRRNQPDVRRTAALEALERLVANGPIRLELHDDELLLNGRPIAEADLVDVDDTIPPTIVVNEPTLEPDGSWSFDNPEDTT